MSPARPGPRLWMVEEFGHGGIGRYAVDVANLVGPVVETVVATTDRGPVAGLRGSAATWFRRGADGLPGKVRAAVLGLVAAMRSVRRGDVAWIPLGIRPVFELLLLLALRLGGARVVATVHNRAPHGSRRDSSVVTATARRAAAVVVHTDAMSTWADQHRMRSVRLPFPPPDLTGGSRPVPRPRAELDVPADRLLVAFLGYLYLYKGPDVLLRALAVARQRRPDLPVHVLMAGTPSADMDLRALVRDLGLEEVVTLRLGWLDEEELGGMLTAADVVALPYRAIDNSGIGAVARKWRIPAVASDLPLLKETYEAAALYARADDPDDLARVLLELPGRLPALREAIDRLDGAELEKPYREFVHGLVS